MAQPKKSIAPPQARATMARIQHLLEVGTGELGHAEELDGIGTRDTTIPVYNAVD
jgi:hypothetical protein